MASWRYTANIPTHIVGKDEHGVSVVLYRVNVFLQHAMEAAAGNGTAPPSPDSAPFFVLRRYSQFRHLHDQLKAAFPALMSAKGMAPPPKHPLSLGDRRDATERRRAELEKWLWRLIGTPDIARSSQLKAFLEFDRALQRAQQHQQRKLEQQRLRGAHSLAVDPHPARSAAPSEIGVLPYNAYGNGLDGDSASTASDISGAPSGAGYPGAAAASSASVPHGPAYGIVAVPGTPGGPSARPSGGGATDGSPAGQHSRQPPHSHHQHQQAHQHTSKHQQQQPHDHGIRELVSAAVQDGGGPGGTAGAGVSTAAGTAAMRLGIRLEGRTDVRRLVDLLVEKLDVACSEAHAACVEASLLRDANRAMAERLGELEGEAGTGGAAAELRSQLEAAEAQCGELRRQMAELEGRGQGLEAALAAAEGRAAEAEEALASRGTAHAQQVSQLQGQLAEARQESRELLGRLQEWDIGSAAAAASASTQQQLDELRAQLDERNARLDEQARQLDEQRRQLDEQRRDLDERQAREEAGQAALADLRKQLDSLRARAEAAEAAAAKASVPGPTHQQQQLDRARADNALLAGEVQRLRAAGAKEREAHRGALAVQQQQCGMLEARVRELEGLLQEAGRKQQQLEEQQQRQGQGPAAGGQGWAGAGVSGAGAGQAFESLI